MKSERIVVNDRMQTSSIYELTEPEAEKPGAAALDRRFAGSL